MAKAIKRIGIVIGVMVALLLIVIIISYGNHRIQVAKEESLFVPNGQIVQVNGHGIHTYIEGKGSESLVFLSGGGTCCPVLDFKSLYSLLSDRYKMAVVEKSGYGFSEDSNISRDMDTMLEETREALSKSGMEPPYILFPHSMSGIEALYWAQVYPDEIKGIIGLDIAVPQAYEDFPINTFMLRLAGFGGDIGITRFFPAIVDDSAAIKYGNLSKEEKDIYRAIFYRRTLTKSMFNEINEIEKNAEKVNANGKPNIPILLFISNGKESGWDEEKWIEMQKSYIETIDRGKSIELDCGHYVHDIEYEKIAKESKIFIEKVISKN